MSTVSRCRTRAGNLFRCGQRFARELGTRWNLRGRVRRKSIERRERKWEACADAVLDDAGRAFSRRPICGRDIESELFAAFLTVDRN